MYLGIDIGTSSVKAVIVDDKDTVVEQASAPLNVSRPQAGWSEQNPADWWSATNAAVKALPAATRKAVKAVGLSGQMHGATLLDAADKPLRPAILWNDGRSETAMRHAREGRAALARHHRQHRDARLHRAEAGVGARERAGGVQGHALRAAAQGLRAPADDGREGQRLLGCRRHAVGGRGAAQVVARNAGRDGLERIAHAAPGGRLGRHRQPAQGSRRGLGHGFRAGGGWRWRQRRGRRGHRRDHAG